MVSAMNLNCGLVTQVGDPQKCTPLRLAKSSNSWPSLTSSAIGFSDQTWRFACRAFLLTGKCDGIDVVFTNRSKGTPASISSIFGYTLGTLNCSARFLARSTMISHTLTTSMNGCEVRFGK